MRTALAIAVFACAAPAWAAVPPSVMYVSAQPGMSKPLAAAVIRGAYKAAKATFGASLIVDWRVLGRRPDKAFLACGADLSCLAKLADKLKADRVLYGRVAPTAGGAQLQILVIGAISETVEQRFAVTIQRASDAQNVIGTQLAALDSAEGLSAAPDSESSLAPPAPVAAAPADTGAAMDFGAEPPAPKPTAVAPAFATADGTTAPPPVLLLAPPRAVVVAKPTHKHPWLLPTGIVTAVVGAGAVGVGVYFGLHQQQLMQSIHYGAGGTTQNAALAISKQANQSAVTADALFIAGGIVTAVGLSLLGVALATN